MEAPAFAILETVEACRRPGEQLTDTAERMLVHEALLAERGLTTRVAARMGCHHSTIARRFPRLIAAAKARFPPVHRGGRGRRKPRS